ncbi:MAG TPA: FkbM family methyltransferase, partial [Nevskiaceae bacterium]|nr:FkbM family methyltransferase [Nevskiaceae bacterium]
LHTDTEGHDYEIIKLIDFGRFRPSLLVYEHHHLTPPDRVACAAHMEALGYETMTEGLDTMCLDVRNCNEELRRVWQLLRGIEGPVPA